MAPARTASDRRGRCAGGAGRRGVGRGRAARAPAPVPVLHLCPSAALAFRARRRGPMAPSRLQLGLRAAYSGLSSVAGFSVFLVWTVVYKQPATAAMGGLAGTTGRAAAGRRRQLLREAPHGRRFPRERVECLPQAARRRRRPRVGQTPGTLPRPAEGRRRPRGLADPSAQLRHGGVLPRALPPPSARAQLCGPCSPSTPAAWETPAPQAPLPWRVRAEEE